MVTMTNKTRFLTICLLTITCVSLLPAASLELTFPSERESTIEYGRDFYVIGQGEGLNAADVIIELYPVGGDIPVRGMESYYPHTVDYYSGFSGFNFFNGDDTTLPSVQMPDLVWDKTIPGSFADSYRKMTVTDEVFAAVISGGVYESENSNRNNWGQGFWTPLERENYMILVTINHTDGRTETLSREITIGTNPVKVLSRFSPSNHLSAVQAEADAMGQRMYLDPYVGYWNASGILYGHQGNPIFVELLDKWQYNDGLEYTTGDVNFYIYNVNAYCATNAVEIGILQKTHRLNDHLTCHYYDIGEPEVILADGSSKMGAFEAFSSGDTMQYTRAQIGESEGENMYSTYLPIGQDVDFDVYDGVAAEPGKTISFFGVVTPIQNDDGDITVTDPSKSRYAFSMANPISSVRYEVSNDEKKVAEFEKPIGLKRNFTSDWKNQLSIYEFRHDITWDTSWGEGTLDIRAVALDAKGNEVAGSTETVKIIGPQKAISIESSPVTAPAPQPPAPSATTSQPPVFPSQGGSNMALVVVLIIVGMLILAACIVYFRKKRK